MAKTRQTGEPATGSCRFCGQSVIVEGGADMTEPQIEEAATMKCGCDEAKNYQQAATRIETAKQRIDELFGEGSGEYAQSEATLNVLKNCVDLVCNKAAKQVSFDIRTGLRCRVMAMAKDKVKVARETSEIDTFEQ